MSSNKITSSHPVIRHAHIPIVPGQLTRLESFRSQLLSRVIEKTLDGFNEENSESMLSEALYSDRLRVKMERSGIFTKKRLARDRRLWNEVQQGLLEPSLQTNREDLLRKVLSHYAEEIGGHFDSRVYSFATRAIPWGFSWLLNAASVQRFLPWGMSESLESRLSIVGEVPHLQKLAQKGTILLVPTHQSNIDSVLIGYVIYLMSLTPFAYGAGLNLFSNPVLNFFMSNLGSYTVDRKKTNVIYKQLLKNYSVEILRDGIHSIFFPGGGRSRSGAIESHIKLGLLGTGLEAQIENLKAGKENPNIYVVPMVTSYHFVLEASSLIEDYLAEAGKHQYIMTDDESWQSAKVFNFFWKVFAQPSGLTVRIGKPLDVFGNLVDGDGRSIDEQGKVIDTRALVSVNGEPTHVPERDRAYTRELGEALVDRFHRDNTVLSSHIVAFAFFEALRRRHSELDLFRFLRLPYEQRWLSYADFLIEVERVYALLLQKEQNQECHLSEDVKNRELKKWVEHGIRNLGVYHGVHALKHVDSSSGSLSSANALLTSEDLALLFYYRNRLEGYGL